METTSETTLETTSIWNIKPPEERPSLEHEIYTDTAIIGGGMAGILTAHFLKQAGIECVVLEAGRIGHGQTVNTTAKVTAQHGPVYSSLLQTVGAEKAGLYARAHQEAIERYEILVNKYGCDCGWTRCPAYLYAKRDAKRLWREQEAYKKLKIAAKLTEDTELPFQVKGALRMEDQARFHPMKFLYCMAEELTVYEHSKVKSVEGRLVKTEKGRVYARRIVFACHYPFVNVPGYYFMRMHQERSYVLALEHCGKWEGMYYGIEPGSLSFRKAGDSLLIGGEGHRTGSRMVGDPYEYLSHTAQQYWPDGTETARWSAQDCMTLDGIPYIGPFSKKRPEWYVATGFGKWGMTSSMVSAMILSDLLCGRKNAYVNVFSPQRFLFQASVGKLFSEGGHSAAGLIRRFVEIPRNTAESVRQGEGKIVKLDGEKYGLYKDKDGRMYAVTVACPHMGCQLRWNLAEKSWDCPCHGSRFDYKGVRLAEPAQEDLACQILHEGVK